MKVDLKRSLDGYRARRGEFRTLELPPLRYLVVDGHGDPNTAPEYAEALATLYPAAYALKLASKRDLGRDYVVPPLEALWWAPDLRVFTSARDKSAWHWTTMVLVPDWLPDDLVADVVEDAVAGADRLRVETLHEGLCVQTLHVGPYDEEAGVLAHLHDHVLPEAGLRPTGKHHEVYLGDPRRAAPSRLRTILRQPVAPLPDGPTTRKDQHS